MKKSSPQNSSSSTKLKGVRVCPKCKYVSQAGAKYCGIDGTALTNVKEPDASKRHVQQQLLPGDLKRQNRCPLCSRTFPQRANFCASDGSKLFIQEQSEAELKQANTQVEEKIPEAGSKRIKPAQADQSSSTGELEANLEKIPEPQIPEPLVSSTEHKNLIGTTVSGRYRIEAIIAEGGMATLYRAQQLGMDRIVAIKVMLPAFNANSKAVERFAQEGKLTARLTHPNIVSVYDIGFIGTNEPYLVMEYIDGQSLAEELRETGPPSLPVAMNILNQVLRGLEEAHSAGIVHRDLKPDNILLQRKPNRSDWVKIVDFGIANLTDSSKRLTKVGAFIGTPSYMAPEQFKNKPLDIRVDLYSLGVVMFEILTGDVPFDGESPDVIIMKHLMEEVPQLSQLRADLPSSLDTVLKKAMAKEPHQRFQNALEFREALEACLKTN